MTTLPLVRMHGSSGAITPRQQQAYDLYEEYRNYSQVGRMLGISAANVMKAIAGYHRNLRLMQGLDAPPLKDMLKRGSGRNSIARAAMVLASTDGVTTPEYALANGDDIADGEEPDRPIPRRVFATGEKVVRRTVIPLPKRGVLRIMFTSAQDATPVHQGLWRNMEAFRREHAKQGETRVLAAPITYNKGPFGDPGAEERQFLSPHELYELDELEIKRLVLFDECLEEAIIDHRHEIDGILDMCAEMNTIPTAVTPLSGLEAYTNGRWGVFPHAKQHIASVARMPNAPPKVNFTTGSCTLPNYIRKKAGMKAEFHHVIGFTMIEVLPDGRFWVRQIEADEETGTFYDLDWKVEDGVVTKGHNAASISYGDVHHEKLDPIVARATWGYDVEKGANRPAWTKKSLIDRLKPTHQFFHDISDFAPRNHHNVKDPHFWAMMHRRGTDSVENALQGVAGFLKATTRDWCTSVVVQSNHDNAYLRWLKEGCVKNDPRNAELWHWGNWRIYQAINDNESIPPIFEETLLRLVDGIDHVRFIDENDSYVVAGIEHSQHGHLGPNGSRGGPGNLWRVAEKLTTGHTHSPFKRDGLVIGGVCQLEMGYNRGPTSWAIAHVLGHQDGSRQLLFMNGDRFAA